jgi:hypothetical protein
MLMPSAFLLTYLDHHGGATKMRKLLLSSVIMLAMSAYVHPASLLASAEGNWATDNTLNCSVPSKAYTLRFFGDDPASEFGVC